LTNVPHKSEPLCYPKVLRLVGAVLAKRVEKVTFTSPQTPLQEERGLPEPFFSPSPQLERGPGGEVFKHPLRPPPILQQWHWQVINNNNHPPPQQAIGFVVAELKDGLGKFNQKRIKLLRACPETRYTTNSQELGTFSEVVKQPQRDLSTD